MLQIIAFDLGTNVAFAHNGLIDGIVCEHIVFEGERQLRLMKFRRYLERMFKNFINTGIDFDAVTYERPFARGFHATRSLWGMAGILESVAAEYWAVLDATPAQIKKFAAEHGQAKKFSMITAANKLGYRGSDEHEADAYCLLKYSLANVQKPEKTDVKRTRKSQ